MDKECKLKVVTEGLFEKTDLSQDLKVGGGNKMETRWLEQRERRVDKMRLARYKRMEIMLASRSP